MTLSLDVRLDGYPDPIGQLERSGTGVVRFTYSKSYLHRDDAIPLSFSLPLGDGAFDDPTSKFFFDNLLYEPDTARQDIIARYRLATDDVVGILEHLGKDCSGAVSVLSQGAPPTKVPGNLATDYTPVTPPRLVAILHALRDRRALPIGQTDPSPLAGVQSKIALTRLPDGSFAEPNPGSGAPTTHILKIADANHPADAALERETLELSRGIGFRTTNAELETIDHIPVLVVERFDRVVNDGIVSRRHQEDFCQALGLSFRQKYERNGSELGRFDVPAIASLLDRTRDPIMEKRKFIRSTAFDLLVGNVDSHAKNFSLFHVAGGGAETTPRYDLLPTRLDPNLTDELAYRIGNAATLEQIDAAAFDRFLEQLGIAGTGARKRQLNHVKEIADALAARLSDVQSRGYKRFADLMASNIRTLLPPLGISVPSLAANRDAFFQRASGAWSNS